MSRTSFLAAALLTLGLAGGLWAFGPRSQTANGGAACCAAGESCCEAGLPCCELSRTTDCCELGGTCCDEQAACCDSH